MNRNFKIEKGTQTHGSSLASYFLGGRTQDTYSDTVFGSLSGITTPSS